MKGDTWLGIVLPCFRANVCFNSLSVRLVNEEMLLKLCLGKKRILSSSKKIGTS